MPSDDLWIEEELSPLPTRRLTLREVRMDDAPAIATLANDRHIAEMTARTPTLTGWRMRKSFWRARATN